MIKKKYIINYNDNKIILPLENFDCKTEIVIEEKYKEWIEVKIGMRNIYVLVSCNNTRHIRRGNIIISNLNNKITIYISQLFDNRNSIECSNNLILANYKEQIYDIYFSLIKGKNNFIVINDNNWIDFTVSKINSNKLFDLFKLKLYIKENNEKKERNGIMYIRNTSRIKDNIAISVRQDFNIDDSLDLIICKDKISLGKNKLEYDLEFSTYPNKDNNILVNTLCNWITYSINKNHIIFNLQKNETKKTRKASVYITNVTYPLKSKEVVFIQK